MKATQDEAAVRVRALREQTGMNRKEFCVYFDIPYRTVSDWEAGIRHAPEYVLRLLEYYIRMQGLWKGEDVNGMVEDSYQIRNGGGSTGELSASGTGDCGRQPDGAGNASAAAEYGAEPSMVCEPAVKYGEKKPGEYTLEDYYALPEDVRAELIDGEIFIMEAPTVPHQVLVMETCRQLMNYIEEQGGDCLALPSPLDVQLDCDDKTMVEPDVVVVCDRDKVVRKNIYGAPDLVIEILSPSTKSRDMILKLGKYQAAGVREYWIVDPDKKRVLVYDFAHDEYPAIYSFEDAVPVGIYEGKCQVDFKKIYERMRFLYEKEGQV